MNDRFIDLKEVIIQSNLSATTIWRRERAGTFPKRRRISPGRVAWLQSEIDDWKASLLPADGRGVAA